MIRDAASGFQNVDRSADPTALVTYLDSLSAVESAQAYKRLTLELLGPQPGDRFLDVGCGAGDDARQLAEYVGPTGRMVGIDFSETMVDEAQRRHTGARLPVEFRAGDAHHLEFADDTFNGCRADRVFQHLERPAVALAELTRVTCPGGHIVVADPDWDSLVVDASDRALTRALVHARCDRQRNGWMGRQLATLFRQCQLEQIAVFPISMAFTDFAVADALVEFRAGVDYAVQTGVGCMRGG